jgi:hypothetical protein
MIRECGKIVEKINVQWILFSVTEQLGRQDEVQLKFKHFGSNVLTRSSAPIYSQLAASFECDKEICGSKQSRDCPCCKGDY